MVHGYADHSPHRLITLHPKICQLFFRTTSTVPKRKRVQREHTEDWQTIQQYTLWPEQTAYELLRPIVLFGDPATKRAEETGEPRPTLERKADAFNEQGMVSFFASRPRKQPQETARSLPPDMRQLIVDLRVELPTMFLREIAEICEARFQRRPWNVAEAPGATLELQRPHHAQPLYP